MAQFVLFEEFHVSVFAPRRLSDRRCRAIQSGLDGLLARDEIAGAIRTLFEKERGLKTLKVEVSR